MFILYSIFSGIYSGLEFISVNCNWAYENPQSNAFKYINSFGHMSNNSPTFYLISFIFFHVRFGKATYLSFLFKFLLSVRLSNSLLGWNVLLISEFINIVSIFVLYLYWLYIIIYFFSNLSCLIEEYIIFLIWFSKLSHVLPAFICSRAIFKNWNMSLWYLSLEL